MVLKLSKSHHFGLRLPRSVAAEVGHRQMLQLRQGCKAQRRINHSYSTLPIHPSIHSQKCGARLVRFVKLTITTRRHNNVTRATKLNETVVCRNNKRDLAPPMLATNVGCLHQKRRQSKHPSAQGKTDGNRYGITSNESQKYGYNRAMRIVNPP